MNLIILTILTIMFLCSSCCAADTNADRGSLCSVADNSTASNSIFHANLNNLLNSLSYNGPLQNGFYKTTAGKKSDKIYGLIQCRGDVSASDCANCTKESITAALRDCKNRKDVSIWFRWCTLRYSNESFFGVWEKSSVSIYDNYTDSNEIPVVSGGVTWMKTLANTAPKQPLMFQASMLDNGNGPSGRSYGMAQCRRDISRSDCGKCLNALLDSNSDNLYIRSWEIYGSSCFVWSNDFQFYFNISTTNTAGARRLSYRVADGIITLMVLVLVGLLAL